jgi:uncharacterized protein (TIGR02145 family)
LSAYLHAQVSIGDLTAPATGALLDLNKTAKGGLLLSNVTLTDLSKIPSGVPNSFPGIVAGSNDDTNDNFKGALVYHIGTSLAPAGIYAWNGKNWTPIGENCLGAEELTLTLTASPSIPPVNTPVTFTVSSNASARCTDGETYTWSVTTGTAGTDYILSPFGNSASIQFITANTYIVRVEAHNSYSTGSVIAETTVVVGGFIPQIMLNINYGLVGKACLDVKNSKQPASQSDAAFAAREDAFSGDSYTKTYKFVHGDTYRNLSLSYNDATPSVIDKIIPPAVSATGIGEAPFTVVFKSDVKNLVPANGDSLTVKLLASYKDSGGADNLTYLEIRVEDGTCVCPSKKNATQWLNFMCHDLGGEDILSSSQLITREHHGDWYRFGAALASMENIEANDGYNNLTEWSAKPVITGSANWPNTSIDANGLGTPCPAGWRLPTKTELDDAVINTANNSRSYPGTWSSSGDNTNFSALMKVGDHLYLPATGSRGLNGELSNRGSYGYLWSSTNESTFALNMFFRPSTSGTGSMNRNVGYSVRCVAVE